MPVISIIRTILEAHQMRNGTILVDSYTNQF